MLDLMMAKNVLLSYLERNKVFKVPYNKEGTDLDYTKGEFIKCFLFERNVGLCLSFQRWDDDWEEFIEIDDSDVITDKMKIKVVVMPIMNTPVSSYYQVITTL